MLLNNSAVAKMHIGEYQEAESSLVEVKLGDITCHSCAVALLKICLLMLWW